MSTTTNRLGVPPPESLHGVRALVVDIFGACVDRQSYLAACLIKHTPPPVLAKSTFTDAEKASGDWALIFRARARVLLAEAIARLGPEEKLVQKGDYRQVLELTLPEFTMEGGSWTEALVADVYEGIQDQNCSDSAPGLKALRNKFVLVGFSNAPTAPTIKVTRKNDYHFDTLLCSDLIDAHKLDPRVYKTLLKLLQAESNPGEVAVVSIYPYELAVAKKLGIKTILISRIPDETEEEIDKHGFDLAIKDGGFVELARRLGCNV